MGRIAKIKRRLVDFKHKTHQAMLAEKIRRQVGECGENLQVFGDVEISIPLNVKIGNNCKLNSKTYINARNGVILGDDVSVSYGVKLLSTGYDIDKWVKTGVKEHKAEEPVYIGNHCWIGAGATILPGVKITGEYVVIGADSVVTGDVTQSKVILAGSPARIIKRIDD